MYNLTGSFLQTL